jgi:hypothetical protein
MKSIWIVYSISPAYKENWGAMFATEREARDWAHRDWGAKCKALDLIPSETDGPDGVFELKLTTLDERTFWEKTNERK